MAVKKDLSVEYLGVKCQNPFFLILFTGRKQL